MKSNCCKIFWLLSLVLINFLNLAAQDNIRNLRGVQWENDRYNALAQKFNYGSLNDPLPISSSIKEHVPRVATQGPYNMSASWAVIWYAGGILKNKACGSVQPTGENPSPFFLHYKMREDSDTNCQEPVSIIDLLESYSSAGSPDFKDFNDVCASKVSSEIEELAKEHQISAFSKLFNTYDSKGVKLYTIKQAISAGSPVVAVMDMPPSAVRADDFWSPKEKNWEGENGHALTVVGYNDNKYGGAVQVVNSWGKSWGNEGYTWIRYQDFALFTRYAFEVFREKETSCPQSLEASVKILKEDGKAYEIEKKEENAVYRVKESLPTGTKFRISVVSEEITFPNVYALIPDGSVYDLYPDGEEKYHSFISESSGPVFLPNKTDYFQLEEPAGLNRFIVFFSTEEWTDEERAQIADSLKSFNSEVLDWVSMSKSKISNYQFADKKIEISSKNVSGKPFVVIEIMQN